MTAATATRPAAPARPVRPRRRRGWLREFALRWAVLAVAVAGWEVATRAADNPFFPTPHTIGRMMREQWFSGEPSRLWLTSAVAEDIGASVARLLGGWAIAGVAGVLFGIALGRSQLLLDLFGPVLHFLRAIPPPALLPVFSILFHIGTRMQVAVIAFGVVWPVLLNAADGAAAVDVTQEHTARAFGLSRRRWLFGVLLPAAAPKIFAGLRISLSLALILMVVSELVGATSGIGYQLLLAQSTFDYPLMWAHLVLLGVLGYLLNTILLAVERRVLRWHYAPRSQPE